MEQSGLPIEKITSVWVEMNVGSLPVTHCLKTGLSGRKKRNDTSANRRFKGTVWTLTFNKQAKIRGKDFKV